MALVQWKPFREIDTLQRRMNRLFDEIGRPLWGDRLMEGSEFDVVPAAEIHETDDAVHLKLEVPGMKPDDLNIEVTADAVSISGERKSEHRSEEEGITRSEFHYGSFRRVIPTPARIDNKATTAEYHDGILTLTMPKDMSQHGDVVKVNVR